MSALALSRMLVVRMISRAAGVALMFENEKETSRGSPAQPVGSQRADTRHRRRRPNDHPRIDLESGCGCPGTDKDSQNNPYLSLNRDAPPTSRPPAEHRTCCGQKSVGEELQAADRPQDDQWCQLDDSDPQRSLMGLRMRTNRDQLALGDLGYAMLGFTERQRAVLQPFMLEATSRPYVHDVGTPRSEQLLLRSSGDRVGDE